jgi:16S rRNA (guanine527-N7)-methyltransferase
MEYNVNRFKELLLEENKKQNLISRRSPETEIDKHIQDCRIALDFIEMDEKRIIDLGSGAGFPGLILAMLVPKGQFCLVEADEKKSKFLAGVKDELRLVNVSVINQRAEILGQDLNFRAGFDYCTSRAVAGIRVLLEYSLPLVIEGGKVVMWKGCNYAAELEEAGVALSVMGGEVRDIFFYTLMEEIDRTLVVVEKVAPTPDKYPRRNGMPAKRPL